MSFKFGTNVEFGNNQALNMLLQILASDPGSPSNARIWYNSTTNRVKWRAGGVTIDPLDRSFHVGTQLASTISNFDTQVRTSRLDQMAVAGADVDFGGFKQVNVGTPTGPTHGVNKAYVDSAVEGLDWKNSVRGASTANLTLSGLQTIDGITYSASEPILVKNQTTQSENGIYTVAAGAWTRRSDAITGKLTAGASVYVAEGTVNGDTQWRLNTDDPITVGTTALAWTQIGAGTSYTPGIGISIIGNVLAIDTAVVVRKSVAQIGNGVLTSIPVTHGLGTKAFTWSIRDTATDEFVIADVVATTVNVATFSFSVAPTTNQYEVTIQA